MSDELNDPGSLTAIHVMRTMVVPVLNAAHEGLEDDAQRLAFWNVVASALTGMTLASVGLDAGMAIVDRALKQMPDVNIRNLRSQH